MMCKKFFIVVWGLFLGFSVFVIVGSEKEFRLGLENLSPDFIGKIKNVNIGLITNQTGLSLDGKRNIDILLKKGLRIKKIFTPEHGLSGMVHTNDKIVNFVDARANIPIITLYSAGRPIKINRHMVKDIDILMFDIQDAGMRHYTYITTLFDAMDSACNFNKKFVVLDRPSLLGSCMTGPLVEQGFKSAVSIASVPLRHGMSVGELAIYFNKHFLKKPIKLYVAKMKNYQRDSDEHNKMLTFLSSGIRNINSCYCYSFLGLLGEISPFNIGLKTDRRFQCIMLNENKELPIEKWKNLQNLLASCKVESFFCRKLGNKNSVSGLELKIKDINNVASFNLFMKIVSFFKHTGITMRFSKLFDLAVGTNKIRSFLQKGKEKSSLEKHINSNLDIFYKKASTCFLYKPFPKINYVDLS
ncbi:exo-beta-N-acetylmuramidase NamZ domain-containing protein [Candidatus Dependentiae bacterium]